MATRDSSESEGTIDETPSEESEADTDPHLSSRQGLPPTFSLQSESVLSWNPHILQSLGRHGGDTILPKDLDEIALEVELNEEEKIDKIDAEADVVHEHALWGEIGVERDVQVATKRARKPAEAKGTYGGKEQRRVQNGNRSLRFREPRGAVKSRVYLDSNEDV